MRAESVADSPVPTTYNNIQLALSLYQDNRPNLRDRQLFISVIP